ncbi:aldo/keto reductase (plasmid) [Comamonadaceae bacterium OTU4NAUVB1]|nr:aldo/keto reductase [Comamonadaceae bacterium OTU4NAUVB1]
MPAPVNRSASPLARSGPTRAQVLRGAAGLALSAMLPAGAAAPATVPSTTPPATSSTPPMHTRPVPSTGEALPVIGCGTWVGFDHAPGSAEHQRLPGVLRALFDAGGRVLDSSPMYGRSEQTTGELLAELPAPRPPAFVATKVWTRGRAAGLAQMERSFALLGTRRIDLMQVHNLVDWRVQLATVRELKAQGRVRHVGITHYTTAAFDEVEAVLRAEPLDFLQINYALDDREVERRLLPLAAERGVAVIVNQPFGGGGLLRRLRERPLPAWAAEIGAASWAQVLLKFTLSHPAVTCVIPGTSRPEHMADNARAGTGPLPDAAFWRGRVAGVLA